MLRLGVNLSAVVFTALASVAAITCAEAQQAAPSLSRSDVWVRAVLFGLRYIANSLIVRYSSPLRVFCRSWLDHRQYRSNPDLGQFRGYGRVADNSTGIVENIGQNSWVGSTCRPECNPDSLIG